MDYVDYAVILLAIVCLLAADGARAVQDSQISHEPPSTGIVEEVVLADSECDKTRITLGDAIYYLDCVGYTPAEGADVSYRANGERIFDIAPADDEG